MHLIFEVVVHRTVVLPQISKVTITTTSLINFIALRVVGDNVLSHWTINGAIFSGALVNSSIREPVYGTLPMEFFALLTLELWETYTCH